MITGRGIITGRNQGKTPHDPVTLDTQVDGIFGLSAQQLTLDSQDANLVLAGPTTGAAADPTFRFLVAADFGTTLSPVFAGLTIGTLAGVLKATAGLVSGSAVHADLGSIGANDHHNAITLAASADTLLGLSTQALSLDSQAANKVLAGPASGIDAVPTFRTIVAADVPDELITYAKMQHVSATDKILGRATAGAGDVEEIACTAAGRALLDDAAASDQRTTLGLGSISTLSVDNVLPWIIDVDVYTTPKSNVNWNNNIFTDPSCYLGYKSGSGAQNNEITWDVVLAAGTWTVELMYVKNYDCGIFSIQFDSTEKGTIDSYAASVAYYQLSSVSSIAVATTAKIELKLKMATKHASASAYNGIIQRVRLMRTA